MVHVGINKIGKELTLKDWMVDNRWTAPKLQKEFEKYGIHVSSVAIWYWSEGKYKPRDKKVIQVFSELAGFDVMKTFTNFKKNGKKDTATRD